MIGVEAGNTRHRGLCAIAQILLVNDAILIDHERHDAARTVFCGVGKKSKTARLPAVDDVRTSRNSPSPAPSSPARMQQYNWTIKLAHGGSPNNWQK
jgi:hypothetical protein